MKFRAMFQRLDWKGFFTSSLLRPGGNWSSIRHRHLGIRAQCKRITYKLCQ